MDIIGIVTGGLICAALLSTGASAAAGGVRAIISIVSFTFPFGGGTVATGASGGDDTAIGIAMGAVLYPICAV
eukprot:CAMPEP_0172433896 /NCGR_PEP_ID=MMETSP1064-20121228/70082_1 /TAXON_ID=202472 /ORGANISM="Aulacoseira subarctica , Strain CCAP 1002/5" /LENGTH=72 /DNA_ID=CAMNT_0013182045 /DNA_START=352 /DNA_END=567 /DNA_ORIENTATION=+